MRRLFAFNMVSLDGFFAGPNGELDWHTVDAEFNTFAIEQLARVDALLFGRVTYEMMAGYWPGPEALADDPEVAGLMNRLPKIVFSRTLAKAEWNHTRLVRDHVGEEIRKLKEQPGKDLALFGSANMLATLMELNLVDEHRLIVNPVVLGSGRPLFQRRGDQLKLKLVRSRSFGNGNVLLCYQTINGA